MRAILGAIGGAGAGALSGAVVVFALSRTNGTVLTPLLVTVGTPGAYVVSWLTGMAMEQEQALLCYSFGVVGTIVLGAAAIGGLAGGLAVSGARREAR